MDKNRRVAEGAGKVVRVSNTVTIEVYPFGTYCIPHQTSASEFVLGLSEQLSLPHLTLRDCNVGGRVLRELDTVGTWPLVQGATMRLLSSPAQLDTASVALTEHARDSTTGLLVPLFEVPGVDVSDASGLEAPRIRANLSVAYLVSPARRRTLSVTWLRPLNAVFRAIAGIALTIKLYVGGIRFRDGVTLRRFGHLRKQSLGPGRLALGYSIRPPQRYGLRAPVDPAALDHALTALDKPETAESGSSKAGVLLTALVPFAMSVLLAVVMRQPYFLLFALTGPILALAQLGPRRRLAPGVAEVRALPGWVQSGLNGQSLEAQATLLQLTVQGAISLPRWPLRAGSHPAAPRRRIVDPVGHRFARGLATQLLSSPDASMHVVTVEPHLLHESWLRWLVPVIRVHKSYDSVPEVPSSQVLNIDSCPTAMSQHDGLLDRWARSLAAYLTAGLPEQQLPRLAPFARVWDPQAGAPLWDSSDDGSLCVPLGCGISGPVIIDLVKDGPHMLVAGTTGAGKSEFLQSLLTATAATYSAHDVNFMLIDYKGGAGLRRCNDLPHSCGMVTDLDAGETSRALAGLRAELKRRERTFHNAGVSDISSYNRSVSRVERIARIVVVVDEFRALSDDHPEFLSKLIRLAAQGRSLGIHLILATQRPAGAIGPELRANINLRVSLRVADEQDSLDVLGVKDGAHLPVEIPGRFLVRVDSSTPLYGQGFYLDAPPLSAHDLIQVPGIRCVDSASSGGLSSAGVPLDVIAALTTAHEARFGQRATRFWSPGLPTQFAGQPDTETEITKRIVALGAPETSTRHEPLMWDHTLGHVSVIGPALRGRTSALLTLAQSSEPGTRIHWIGSPTDHARIAQGLAASPVQLVNLLDPADPYLIHAALRAITEQGADPEHTKTLLIIDDLDALRTTLETYDRGSGMGLVENLLKTGPARALHCAASTARPITGGLQSLFGQRIVLSSGNHDTDAMNGVPRELLPLPSHLGRAVWQTAHRALPCQLRAPELGHGEPEESCDAQRVYSLSDVAGLPAPGILTGPHLGRLDPTGINPIIVAGGRRSGRSTTLEVLRATCAHKPERVRVIAGKDRNASDLLAETHTALEIDAHTVDLIQIDDLDVLDATQPQLLERLLTTALDANIAVHVSCTTSALAQSYRGALATLREYENVLLLDPDPLKDRELLGTPITLALDPRPYLGKAVLMLDGRAVSARIDCGTTPRG